MPTEGPLSPASGANDASDGDVAWSNPGNIVSSDDSRATSTLTNQSTQYLVGTNFGFAIPAGATIDGILVEWERSAGTANRIIDAAVRIVKGGVIGATDKSVAGFWPATVSESYQSYGGAADLWGETWTPTDINASNFGATIRGSTTASGVTAQIDHVRITVTYTEGSVTVTATATGIASFHQSISLSISVFEPLVAGSTLVDDSLGDKLDSGTYSHTISALGGYDSALIKIVDQQIDLEDWLADGLMRHIEVYNSALVKIWEGFVNQIDIILGGLSVTRGPLLQVSNNVALTYSTVDTTVSPPAIGMRATTAFNSDADSQALYGVLEAVLSAGGVSTTEATTVRDVFLNENKDPQTSQRLNVGQGGDISLSLNCLGYNHLFKKYVYNQTASTGTANLSTVLAAIIAADPNSIFSTSTSKITANTLQVKQYLNDNATAWSLIQGLVARGDSSDNRYIFGIYNDRIPEYAAIPTDFEYQQRLSDPAQRVETPQGVEVKPWDVLAGKWLFVPDFLIGQVQPTDLRLDPRMIFIESLTYTMPWGLQIQGGKTQKLPQKLAKLGLGGIGSGV